MHAERKYSLSAQTCPRAQKVLQSIKKIKKQRHLGQPYVSSHTTKSRLIFLSGHKVCYLRLLHVHPHHSHQRLVSITPIELSLLSDSHVAT